MISGIYVFRDLVAKSAVGGLQLFPHHAVAVRAFSDVCAQPDTSLARHPSDFDVVVVGEFDAESLVLTPSAPEVVFTGTAWAAMQDAAK